MARWLWLSAAILLVDQISKQAAEHLLTPYQPVPLLASINLTLAYNTGAAFSFLAGGDGWQRWLFLALGATVSVALTVWLIRLPRHEKMLALALALVLGGAAGNLVDRALFGHVIDFLDLYHPALAGWPGFSASGHWPIFNVADIAISCGAVLLIAQTFTGARRAPEAE